MNASRRKKIGKLSDQLREYQGKVEDLKSELETIKDEEQDYFDAMPESFQGGEKGEASQSAIDSLDNAFSEIESAYDSLDNCVTSLEEIE